MASIIHERKTQAETLMLCARFFFVVFLLALKKTTQTFSSTLQIKERLENEDLIQRIQDMEQSTERVSVSIAAILKVIVVLFGLGKLVYTTFNCCRLLKD